MPGMRWGRREMGTRREEGGAEGAEAGREKQRKEVSEQVRDVKRQREKEKGRKSLEHKFCTGMTGR
eukprot:753500-Hanusia_phi.AAC.2